MPIPRPHHPDDLRRVVLYPALDRCGSKRTPRADGFHAFRRAASKYLRKAGGLELAAVQLGHKRMTTTDEHYNDLTFRLELEKGAVIVVEETRCRVRRLSIGRPNIP